mmetsp:Transcript_59975/g.98950  ORF Transcript_59975/g.98950 Transcript_59975/m.98950 type:complete len:236 (+) Transcript_59975:380-1087(+)
MLRLCRVDHLPGGERGQGQEPCLCARHRNRMHKLRISDVLVANAEKNALHSVPESKECNIHLAKLMQDSLCRRMRCGKTQRSASGTTTRKLNLAEPSNHNNSPLATRAWVLTWHGEHAPTCRGPTCTFPHEGKTPRTRYGTLHAKRPGAGVGHAMAWRVRVSRSGNGRAGRPGRAGRLRMHPMVFFKSGTTPINVVPQIHWSIVSRVSNKYKVPTRGKPHGPHAHQHRTSTGSRG